MIFYYFYSYVFQHHWDHENESIVLVCQHYLLIKLIYFFIFVALGLQCCACAFSSCGQWGPLFLEVCGLLTVVASLVVEYRP